MAKVTSGSFNTSAYSNRYLTFSWTCTQDVSTNTSTISWTLKGAGSASGYYKAAPFSVTIAGEEVYNSSTRIELWNGTTVASGTKKITHNTDGTKSFSASVKAAIYAYANNVSGSGSWDLKDIPRGATITEAPNFNDEENPVIKYSNPAGSSVTTLMACISFDKNADNIKYRDISKTGSSYTFSLTTAERNTIRSACANANSMTVYFYIRTIIGGNTFHSSIAKTVTIKNGSATLSPTVVDSDSTTKALTGDANKLIKYYSDAQITTGAAARKNATIKSQKVTCGAKSISTASGTISNVESGTFVFEVTDSRGNRTEQTVTKTLVNYVKLTSYIKVDMLDTSGNVSFTISGNYFNSTFGSVANTLTVQYRYKEDGGSYSSWIAATPTKSGNKYNVTVSRTGLDYRKTYIFQARAIDKLATVNSTEEQTRAQPVFDWGENDFNFNVPVTYNGVKLFYTSGDSVSFYSASANFAGCVSDGTKTLYFTIPLCKPVMAEKVSLSGYVIGRGINGYINGTAWGDSTAINMSGSTGYTITTHLRETGVDVLVTFTSAITNATNNTPVNLHPYGTLTLTFN